MTLGAGVMQAPMCPERIATPWWSASMISTGELSAENLFTLRKE